MSNQEENQNINSKDFLLGTLIGGIVGASVALLYAPKPGKELRQDLNEGANLVRERAGEWKDVAYEKGSEWRQLAQEKSGELSSTFTDKTKDLSDRVKDTKNQLQSKVAEFRGEGNKDEELADTIEEAADAIEEDVTKE
ncbi:Gas vesicle protein [Salinibacillus kushneri]|uniref:Gas vesicle protein n=1 Tax=Salinibacillus kushneri TaxID=237682 RepID=A0A1I0JCL5_9BACI|nr:YtxH domain-containing protein [Salinibacillus kushneri]SEU07683.1 Gas vesicle protein [Salinibacillus kushneri]